MIKKSDLRSEFERIVTTQKRAVFRGIPQKIDSFFLREFGSLGSKSGCFVALMAVHWFSDTDACFVTLARSYPMSYKSAYQTMVRL